MAGHILAGVVAAAIGGTGLGVAATVDPPEAPSSTSRTWSVVTPDYPEDGRTWYGKSDDEPGFVHRFPEPKSSAPSTKAPRVKAEPKRFVPRRSCPTVGTVNGVPYVTVRPGDTLGGIARCSGALTAEIARQNKIKDPNMIRVGQKVKLTK